MEDAYHRVLGIENSTGSSKPLLSPRLHPTGSGSATVSDDEVFIRKTLVDDSRLGVELLYKRYYQPMCTHAVKFVGSREVAEDLVSEIFFSFYSKNTFLEINTFDRTKN